MLGAYLGLFSAYATFYYFYYINQLSGMVSVLQLGQLDAETIISVITFAAAFAGAVAWSLRVRVKVAMGVPPSRDAAPSIALAERMRAYANLAGLSSRYPDSGSHFSVGQHLILLGALKKVEAKNSVLATVTALLYAGVVSGSVAALPHLHLPALFALAVVFSWGILILAALIEGAAHISNDRMTSLDLISATSTEIQKAMQSDLAYDLLFKEHSLRFSELTLGFSAVVLILGAVSEAFIRLSC